MNLVSVITAVDGDRDGLTRLTQSLIAQSYPYWEMVVVNDDLHCYRRLLAERGIRDPRLRFLWSARPGSGLEVARNTGVFYARGNFIAPMDTHSRCHPERLDRLVHMALEYGICGDDQSGPDSTPPADDSRLFTSGDGIRWLPLKDKRLPLDMLFHRDRVHCRPRERSCGDDLAGFDAELVSTTEPVPLIETILHARHNGSSPDWQALARQSLQQDPPIRQDHSGVT